MKRKWRGICSILLTLCMVFTMLPGVVFAVQGDEFTVDNLKYKVLTEGSGGNPGTVALVGYPEGNAPTGALTVAETVYSEGITYSITEIGNEAFSLCDGITEVVIGDSVENVDAGAFESCDYLADITLGNSVKTIGDSAFNSTIITSINLPASVELIGEDAFYGCGELAGFTVDEANSSFSAEDGVLYSKDGKTLILYPTGKTGDSYTIPDSVETIGKSAFEGNIKLTHIGTQNTVTIGEGAFTGSALESINIGDSVVTIGKEAFMNCLELETVTISANSLLETIGDSAFGMCEALNSIELPASLKTIGGGAFGYCHSLESLWIGPLVNAIGTNAFYAEKLADFTVDPANEHYSSADNVLYDRNKTTLIRYMQAKTDTSFSIPATVTKIEKSAFYATYELETVTIPSVVNNIGDSAFYWSGIKSAIFLGDTPPATVGSGIFASCSNLTNIYVPEGSVDAYKSALGTDYASKVTALLTINQAGWEALIADNGAAINDGDFFILGEDVTGSLYRSNALPNLTIDGNGHTINGNLYFAQKINLTLKDIAIQGSDNWDAIRFANSSEGSRLMTSGTVAITGGKGDGGLGFYGEAGVYSNADLTITASDKTTITAGDANEEFNFSLSAVWVERGSLTLDGGSPTFQGGKGYSSYGALVGKTENPGDLIITSGSPIFKGSSFSDTGIDGANVTGTIRISSAGSPQFIGADGRGDSARANGARALNLEITAGAPIFKGGSASGSEWSSFAGHGISISERATILGTASPTFTGGDGAADECGGDGLSFNGGLTISTSGNVTFTGGSNCRYTIGESGGGSVTKTGINLKDLAGKITVDNSKGIYRAIGLLEGSSITYPEGLAEARKYNGTDKIYTLDMGDENPTTNHAVTVTNGTANPTTAAAGTMVTITANTAPSGQRFKEWSISPAITFVEGTSKTNSTAKFSMPAQAVMATATYAGSGSSGGGSGGGGGGGTTTQPAAPAAGGAVTVNYTASNGTAALSLPAAKVNDIIAKSTDGAAVIDLSKVSGVTAASLPKAAISAMNEAGLDVTVKLPAGTIILDEDAAASIVEQVTGSNLSIELQPVSTGSLTPAQQEAVQSGDIVLDINILSGSQQISSFDGVLSVQVPYNGPQPVAVWYLNDAGQLEKLDCTVHNGIVSFDLDHLSLYVVGQDNKEADKEKLITEDKEPGWKNPFTDVKAADWFYDAVQYVNEKGLMAGTGNTTFSPHDNTTRGMIVTILYRLQGTPTVSTANPFNDVAAGQYYADAVVWAAENQIVSGYGDGKFGPNDPITREQMAVIMMKYAQTKGYEVSARADLGKYSDTGAISGWAKEALSWANTAGLIQGDGTKLTPGGKAQRCQVASILNRFIENIAK